MGHISTPSLLFYLKSTCSWYLTITVPTGKLLSAVTESYDISDLSEKCSIIVTNSIQKVL